LAHAFLVAIGGNQGHLVLGGIILPSSLAQQFCEAGQELAAAGGIRTAAVLNEVLNRHLGWPFRASTGSAIDLDGQKTPVFGTVIYTATAAASVTEPVEVTADSLACVVDVSETMDLAGFSAAYGRISQAACMNRKWCCTDFETRALPDHRGVVRSRISDFVQSTAALLFALSASRFRAVRCS
jgi:hypothetical protein